MVMGGLDIRPLPIPDRFRSENIADKQFHRFAVAYGLSQDPFDSGDFLLHESVPTAAPKASNDDWTARYVGADQV